MVRTGTVIRKNQQPQTPTLPTTPQPMEKPVIPSTPEKPLNISQPKAPITPKNIQLPTKAEQISSVTPKIIRDEKTGKSIGVQLPGEEPITGLKTKEISGLIAGYYNSNARKEAVQANLSQQQNLSKISTNDTSNDNIPTVGNTPIVENMPSYDPVTGQWSDPIAASIQQNAQQRSKIAKIPVVNVLNKLTGALPNEGGIKKVILALAGEHQGLRNYLNDYSDSENIKAIDKEVSVADQEISTAKDLALDYRYSEEAIQIYQSALMRKQRAYNNYKRISKTDQYAYATDVKNKMVELESYFAKGKINDDRDMDDNLLKAKTG